MERDVRAAIAAKERSAAAPPAAAAPQGAPPAAPSGGGAVPLSRMRQAIARRMAESKATAPHFYATVEIRMDAAQRLRHSLNGGGGDDGPVTGNDLVVAACARALREVPALNASWRDGSVVVHPEVGIGIAVALEGGLVTPVVHGADRLGLRDLSAATHGAVERARAGRLRPEDLSGGTFTVSNMSMLGVDEFIAIINPPEAAILAVGAVVRRPVADGDAIRIARVMKATLSVDHRVADGATAARFLQVLRELLEKPDPLAGGDPSAEAR
jgi:pyruvate dehydrogenase E2 component (dihydrolipoamide acetyltransferase)